MIGRSFGRYLVSRELGSGGMSIVYAAYDRELGREVALKVMKREQIAEDAERRRVRLLREAHALQMIAHPHVVRVYEAGMIDDLVYVSMELIDGGSLRDWLAARMRSRAEILAVFLGAARGLAAAHDAGLVHRDFKPSNVMVANDGRAVVTDFGLVRLGRDAPASTDAGLLGIPLTIPGSVLGTPGYMAPEQIQGAATDARTDQFGFCVALYESIYGESPFAGESSEQMPAEMAIALEVVQGRVRAAPRGSTVPSSLRAAIVKGLAVEPDDRHRSMHEVIGVLERALEGERRGVPQVASRPRSRAGVAAVAFAFGALVFAGGVSSFVWTRAAGDPRCHVDSVVRARIAAAGPRYLAEWTAAHDAACSGSERGLDCLDLCARELAALEEAAPSFDRRIAPLLSLGLTRPSSCTGKAPPNDAGAFPRWLELAREVAAGRVPREDAGDDPVRLTAIGRLYAGVRRWSEAESRFRRARAALEALGADHPELPRALEDHGIALAQMSRTEEAIEVLGRALEMRDRVLGKDHVDSAFAAGSLGAALIDAGEHARALELYRRALPVFERELGANDMRTGEALIGLARSHRGLGEPDAALAVLSRALEIADANHDAGPFAARAAFALGDLSIELGRAAAARAALGRALAIARADAGFEKELLADVLADVGIVEAMFGERRSAVERLERALEIADETTMKPRSIARMRFALARALVIEPADRGRAIALAAAARADLERDPKAVAERAAIDEWLAATTER